VRTLVITPTYVEAENIEEFLRRARAALPSGDILVVDDNSPDGTADLADEVGAQLGRIEVLRRPRKIGIGAAVRAGFDLALDRGYEIVVQIDALHEQRPFTALDRRQLTRPERSVPQLPRIAKMRDDACLRVVAVGQLE